MAAILCVALLTCVRFSSVEQDEYAVVLNSYTMQFRSAVYSQGFYFLVPGDRFIRFKRTLQNAELGDMDCLTKDEVLVDLHVATQFQYTKDDLVPFVLKKFGTDRNYKHFLAGIMRSVILNTCLEFTALEYYEKRAMVDAEMFGNLIRTVNSNRLGCTIEYFQLVDIDYPKDYMKVLHEKQNVKQNLITAENHRTSEVISATTTKMEAQRTANINMINAYNVYNMTLFDANVQKDAIMSMWRNRGLAYKNVIKDLELSVPQFIEYLQSDVVRTSQVVTSV